MRKWRQVWVEGGIIHKHDILAKLCAGKQAEYGDTRVRHFFFLKAFAYDLKH